MTLTAGLAPSFFDTLEHETEAGRRALFEIPFVQRAVAGTIDLATYVAFLTEAYHHVKHTVPLLMATGAALGERQGWVQGAVCEYIAEERGHELWILDDLRACGADADAVRRGSPGLPCELMVAYAYDTIQRRNPMGFFGMVHVLEGTSVKAACEAAAAIRASLSLPSGAFTYLTSHGTLDREHVDFFARLMNRVSAEQDRRAIVHASRVFYRLYGDIFRSLLPTTIEEDSDVD